MFVSDARRPAWCTNVDLSSSAHRHHGWGTLSGGNHASRHAHHAHAADHDRLWHDRNVTTVVSIARGWIRWINASSTVGRIQPHVQAKVVDENGCAN
jgi:hypothetical protein